MSNPAKQLSQGHDVSAKVTQLFQTRTKLALERFNERVRRAYEQHAAGLTTNPIPPREIAAAGA